MQFMNVKSDLTKNDSNMSDVFKIVSAAQKCCGCYYSARMGLCKCVTLGMGVGVLYYNERSRRVPGVSRARQGTFCHDNRHKGEETTAGPRWQQSCKLSNYFRMLVIFIVKYVWLT